MAKREENISILRISKNKHKLYPPKISNKTNKTTDKRLRFKKYNNSHITGPLMKKPPETETSQPVVLVVKKRKNKLEVSSTDETSSEEQSTESFKSKLLAKKNVKKKSSDASLVSSAKPMSKVVLALKSRVKKMSQRYDLANMKASELEEALDDINLAFTSLSCCIRENRQLIQHITVQKFLSIERKKERIFHRFNAIQCMIKDFGADLEWTKNLLSSVEEHNIA